MKIKIPLLCFALALLFSVSMPLQAAKLNIGSAKYDAKKGELKVSGGLTGAPAGTKYSVFDEVTGRLLGAVVAGEKYQLVTGDFDVANPPCSVRVEAAGQSAVANVRDAPAECSVVKFTLTGVVRDAPIPYATVTVTVGGNTFTTVADANGNFVIEIAGIDLSSLVLIESTGETDESIPVDMASIAGTLAKLVEDADGDGIVDGTENPNINNTPYTTALFVLVGEANGGETPTTLEELQEAERSVDATELLQLAAVIKLIVDEGYTLPIDPSTGLPYETIIGFLADAEVDGGGNTPVENFIAVNSAAIDTAVEAILNDNDIVPAFTTAGIPDRYYGLVPAQVGFLSRYGRAFDFERTPAQTGEIRAIRSNGSGVVILGEYTWDVVNGKLELDWTVKPISTGQFTDEFSAPPDQTLRCREPANPQFASCPYTCEQSQIAWAARVNVDQYWLDVTEETSRSEFTKYAVSAGGTREFASQTDVIIRNISDLQVDYDGPNFGNPPETFQFCDESETYTSNVELLNTAVNPPKRLEVADYAGDTIVLPIIYDPDDGGSIPESLFTDFVTLNDDTPDGDGYRSTTTLLSGANLKWRIVDDGAAPSDTNGDTSPDGNELQFLYPPYPGGIQQTLKQLEPSLGVETAFWMEVNGVPQPYGRYDIALSVDPTFQFTEPYLLNNPGEFWNAVILNGWQKTAWQTTPLGQLEITGSFGWEFAAAPSGKNLQQSGPVNLASWGILGAPFSAGLGQLQDLPAGTVRIQRGLQDRFWVPIAETSVSVPGDVNHAPTPRTRFYAVEMFYCRNAGGCGGSGPFGAMLVAPRINAEEIFYKTVFPWYVP